MSVASSPALSLTGVSKQFGAVTAIDDVGFEVARGSVHALLGENGAGKTTLMRIAYGLVVPDRGNIALFGHAAAHLTPRTAHAAGVGMVQQHLSLAPHLSATENVVLGGRGVYRPRAARELLDRVMASSGLRVAPDALVRDLSIVERQRLEILKALARDAQLLILDEPTPGLAPSEIADLLRWIRAFADGGGSVVLVTHKLREARAVADHVTIMRRGRVVLRGRADAFSDAAVADAMFPDAADASRPAMAVAASRDPVLRATNLHVRDANGTLRIRDASVVVSRGDIVGVAAVEGAGHRALLQAFAGQTALYDGTLALPARIALIPADRLRDAIIPEFSLVENLALRGASDRRGRMPWASLRARTGAVVARFGIATASIDAAAGSLSGGNQQRLVVGRELEEPVDLVVADNPTRGLDLRAVGFVHDQLRAAAAAGAAVVVYSSDLDELFAVATRMLVVFHGTVSEVPLQQDVVGRAMIGA